MLFIASRVRETELQGTELAHFKEMDRDKDGKLHKDELKEFFSRLDTVDSEKIGEVMDSVDADKNGFIDYTEFLAVCLNAAHLEEHYIKEAFDFFDKDGNGEITLEEMKEHIKDLGQQKWADINTTFSD